MKEILIASDHAGFNLKSKIIGYLEKRSIKFRDLGTYSPERCHYPEFASRLALQISRRKFDRGILICYSGIGNSIVANRYPGVRAALVHDLKTARLSREHNDSNILVLGAGFVSESRAKRIVDLWLKTAFSGGRHAKRLGQLKIIEREIKKCKP